MLFRFQNLLFVFALALLGLSVPLSSSAQERLPLYTQSWGAADINEKPGIFEMIDAFGQLHVHDAASKGDVDLLSDEVIKIFYLDAISMHFSGIPYPDSLGLLYNEPSFYHGGPPETGVGWHEADGVHLRWEPDYRFVAQRSEVGEPAGAAASISGYWVHRVEDDESLTSIGSVVDDSTSIVDPNPNPGQDNRYIITTYDLSGDPYPLSDPDHLIVVPIEDVPVFWPAQKAYVETADAGNNPESQYWRVDVGSHGAFDPANLKLEVVKTTFAEPYEEVEYLTLGDPGDQFFEFTFDNYTFKKSGGGMYRFLYTEGDDTLYYPAPLDNGDPCYYRPTINNRSMSTNWWSYLLNPGYFGFQMSYASKVEQLQDGGIYDGMFMDNAAEQLPEYTYTRLPYDYQGDDQFKADVQSMVNHVTGANPSMDFYFNTMSPDH